MPAAVRPVAPTGAQKAPAVAAPAAVDVDGAAAVDEDGDGFAGDEDHEDDDAAGSGWDGQVASTRAMAARSAGTTQRP